MSVSIPLANATLDSSFAGDVRLALFVGGVEVSGGGYSRASVAFAPAALGHKSSASDVVFPRATATWGLVDGWALVRGTTTLMSGALTPAVRVANGAQLVLSLGAVDIDILLGDIPAAPMVGSAAITTGAVASMAAISPMFGSAALTTGALASMALVISPMFGSAGITLAPTGALAQVSLPMTGTAALAMTTGEVFSVTPSYYWPFDALNGSNVFPSSVGTADVTPTGAVSTVAGKVGNAAAVRASTGAYTLDGPPNAYATLTASIAGWFKLVANPNGTATIFNKGSSTNAWTLQVEGTTLKFYYGPGSLATSPSLTLGNVTLGTWVHVAIIFSYTGGTAGTVYAYVNGVLVASTTQGNGQSGGPLLALGYDPNNAGHTGDIDFDEWATWNGLALSAAQVASLKSLADGHGTITGTAPTMVPVPQAMVGSAALSLAPSAALTLPDPYFNNVVFLSHLDTTAWTDVTGRNVASTTGDATLGTGLYGGGASVPQPGNPIRYPASSDFILHSDFTVEAAVNAPGLGVQRSIVEAAVPATSLNWAMWIDSTGKLQFHNGSGFPITSPSAIPVNTWTRLAVTFVWGGSGSTGTYRMYIDGTLVATASASWPTFSSNPLLAIGGHDDDTTHGLGGVVDEVRITSGVARYTGASYTLDTAPFPGASTSPDGYWDLSGGIVSGAIAAKVGSQPINVPSTTGISIVAGASPRGGPVLRFTGSQTVPPNIAGADQWAPFTGLSYTFGGWFYAPNTDSGNKAFFRHPASAGGSGPGLERHISGLGKYTATDSDNAMPFSYDQSVPHFVLTKVTRNGSQLFSVDGSAFAYPASIAAQPTGPLVYLSMANSTPVYNLIGDLADIVLWKRAITDAEAAAAYSKALVGPIV